MKATHLFLTVAVSVALAIGVQSQAKTAQFNQGQDKKDKQKDKDKVYEFKKDISINAKLLDTDGVYKFDVSKLGPKYKDDEDALPGWVKTIGQDGQPCKIYQVKFKKGDKVEIRANSDAEGNGFDAVLVVEDAKRNILDADDDGGGDLNSLITFTAPEDGTYRIIVSHHPVSQNKAGDFELKITK